MPNPPDKVDDPTPKAPAPSPAEEGRHLMEVETAIAGRWSPRRKIPAMRRGEGLWVWDIEDNRYLDMTSAYGVTCLGHCHPNLVSAIASQAEKLMSCPLSLFNEERAHFLEKLAALLPGRLDRAFLCNSGAEANEAALKFARLHSGRQNIVAIKNSFHGRTAGALSATWNPKTRKPFEPLLGNVTFVRRGDLEGLDAAINDSTAAVITEIVQGEGGVFPLAEDFLAEVHRLTTERGALRIVDEIQTGLGRTGSWFAHTEILSGSFDPDIMTLAKGLGGGFPIGATTFSAALEDSLFPGAHGSTFGGNPLACAAARATLETLEEQELPQRARTVGAEFLSRLQSELGNRPAIREIRGQGLMIGIELREKAGRYLAQLMNLGLIALPAGPNVVRLLPALIAEEQHFDEAITTLKKVLPGADS